MVVSERYLMVNLYTCASEKGLCWVDMLLCVRATPLSLSIWSQTCLGCGFFLFFDVLCEWVIFDVGFVRA